MLILRHSVFNFPPNFRDITYKVVKMNFVLEATIYENISFRRMGSKNIICTYGHATKEGRNCYIIVIIFQYTILTKKQGDRKRHLAIHIVHVPQIGKIEAQWHISIFSLTLYTLYIMHAYSTTETLFIPSNLRHPEMSDVTGYSPYIVW